MSAGPPDTPLPSSFGQHSQLGSIGTVVPRILGCHAEEFNRRGGKRERKKRPTNYPRGLPSSLPLQKGARGPAVERIEAGTVPGEAEWRKATRSTRSVPTVSKKVREAEVAMEPVGAAKGEVRKRCPQKVAGS